MSESVWVPLGAEYKAYYSLESVDGQEIAGGRGAMCLRDMARWAHLLLDDGLIYQQSPSITPPTATSTSKSDGNFSQQQQQQQQPIRLLPEGWVKQMCTRRFALTEAETEPLITHYGYSMWLGNNIVSAIGFAGQRIDILPQQRALIVTLGAFPQPPWVPSEKGNRRVVAQFVMDMANMLTAEDK